MRSWLILLVATAAHAADFVPMKVDPARHAIRAIVRDHDQWVAAGGGASAALFRSPDGEHWTRTEVSRASGPLRALVGDNHGDLLAVGGAKSASGVTSPDGAETALPIGFERSAALEAMARRQDQVVAVGEDVFVSLDGGDRWKRVRPLIAARPTLHGVVDAGEVWVAVGDEPSPHGVEAVVLRSNDGERWTRQILTRTPPLLAIARVGENLIAVGRRGGALISDDRGETWQPLPLPTTADLHAIASGPSGTWIVGEDGLVLHSDDGQRFVPVQLDTRSTLLSVLATSEGTLLGTDDGYVLVSK